MPPSPGRVLREQKKAEEAAVRLRAAKIEAMRERPECSEPTEFLPGSPEKIEVMRKRVEQGFSPWHRQDARRNAQ